MYVQHDGANVDPIVSNVFHLVVAGWLHVALTVCGGIGNWRNEKIQLEMTVGGNIPAGEHRVNERHRC